MGGHANASSLIRQATIQRFPYVIAFEKHEQHALILVREPFFTITAQSPLWTLAEPEAPKRYLPDGGESATGMVVAAT